MVAIEDKNSKHNHKEYSDITSECWRKYCEKRNIDFIVITKLLPNVKHSKWNKHYVFDYLGDKYEKIGMVDFDTIPHWDCPNPFDLYTDEFCGVIDNSSLYWLSNSLTSYKSAFPELNIDIKISEYINSGVLFFTKNHRYIFDQVRDFYLKNQEAIDNWNVPNTGRDQTVLNLILKKNNVHKKYLPHSWNTFAMIKKGYFFYNDKLNDQTPFFVKYGNIWHFTGFSIEQRTQIIKDIWNQTKQLY
jgi:hypothetical protein